MADDTELEQGEESAGEKRLYGRRDFLRGLKKWSAVVIGGAVLGTLAAPEARAGWVNRRGGWVNGGASWVNRGGSWVNGGGGGGWVNRGGSWVNGRGGGWVNR